MSRKIVIDETGEPITQRGYDALVRSQAQLALMVVWLEDELDKLRVQLGEEPTGSKVPESAQTPPDTLGVAEEGRSQSSTAASTAPTEIA